MDGRIFAPMRREVSARDQDLYCTCLLSSILMFIINLAYVYILLFFIADHDYVIITEYIAVALVILISFSMFVALSTLYTITMNEHAYVYLKDVCLGMAGAYLTTLTIGMIALLILSMDQESSHHWDLFKMLIWPVSIEYVVYITAAYSFYNMYPHPKVYFVVPTTRQPTYYFYP